MEAIMNEMQLKACRDALSHALDHMSRDQQATMTNPTYEEALDILRESRPAVQADGELDDRAFELAVDEVSPIKCKASAYDVTLTAIRAYLDALPPKAGVYYDASSGEYIQTSSTNGLTGSRMQADNRLKIATDALQKIASTESAGAMKYIVESAAMRVEAETALSQIQQEKK